MNELERILELLDKDSLTTEENEYLSNALNNPEARSIKETYLRLKNSLKHHEHIDEELLAEYVLYKNNLTSERLIIILSHKIENHLSACTKCKNLFRELNSEYSDVDTFVANAITQKQVEGKVFIPTKAGVLKNFRAIKYAFASVTAIAIIYFGLFFVSSITTPDYKKSFLDDEDFYTSRGRASESFQRGLDAIDNKNFDAAIKYLEEDLAANSESETIFYTHFILGITYINKAENDYLGLFKSFNREDVMKGIESFNKSIQLNTSGSFDNLKLDAHYYIGKAYLLIDNIPSAKKHLKIVVDGKGSYYKKAEELLKIL